MNRLNADQLKKVEKVKPTFLTVQQLTNVPWEMLAGCWTRESFSVASPKTPGGPFQFDPPPAAAVLDRVMQSYAPSLTTEKRAEYIKKGVNDFESAALFCALWLRLKAKGVISLTVSDDIVKDAFWGYNGRAFGSAEHSPYVMSQYSPAYCDMHLIGSIPDKNAPNGRRQINIVDKRPGAFTVYKQLKNELDK